MSTKKVFFNSAAYTLLEQYAGRPRIRRPGLWILASALLALASFISIWYVQIFEQKFDLVGLCVFFMAVTAVLGYARWTGHSELMGEMGELATKWYHVSPTEFYQMSVHDLQSKADLILIQLAKAVFEDKKSSAAWMKELVTNPDTLDEHIINAAGAINFDAQSKKKSFENAYADLKNAGIIEDKGYGYYYQRAQEALTGQR